MTAEAPPVAPVRRGRALVLGSLLVAVAVLVADQLTKWWALEALDGGRTIDLVWTLRFKLVFNSGMAFGQAQGLGPVIAVVALVVLVVLLVSLARGGGRRDVLAVGLVVGGAAGNLADRVFRAEDGLLTGAVVDFIDLQWWPVFNLADAAIVVGGLLLVLGALRRPRPAP